MARLRPFRLLGVLVLAGAIGLATAGCGVGWQAAGCAQQDEDGDGLTPVDCADPAAEFRVLARDEPDDGSREDCYGVAGVTDRYWVAGVVEACLGPMNVDPATAINVAQPGECTADINAATVRRADCASPEAEYRILERITRSPLAFSLEGVCSEVPGTTMTYTWALEGGKEIVFCLAPKSVDL